MKVVIDNQEFEVIIVRKKTNKNTYLRVNENLNIYVTTNYYTKDKEILKLINDNQKAIIRMKDRQKRKKEQEETFTYLGKSYDIVYLNTKDVILSESRLLINKDYDINKWLLKQAKVIFQEELDKIYNIFPTNIPYPSLTIRSMKTRWGVCNVRTKRVTLNLELIKKDIKYLDYVIAHELSHLVYPNHSNSFWKLVEKVIPNYKLLRKEMRNYE